MRRLLMYGLAAGLVGILKVDVASAQPAPSLIPRELNLGTKPRATVFAVGLDPLGTQRAGLVTYFGEQALMRSNRLELVKLVDGLDPDGARTRNARAQDGENSVGAGQKAYDELDTQKSLAQFERAVKAYESADLSRYFPELSRAWVMKIASLVANGETKAVELEMDRLIPLDPRTEFSSKYFHPDQIKQVERIRRRVGAGGTEELEVRTHPEGARVYLNGQFRGVSPVVIKGLFPAEHYLTVMADGYALLQQRARPGRVDLTLRKVDTSARYQAAVDRAQKDPEGPGRDSAAMELGRASRSEQVIVVLAKGGFLGQRLALTALRLDARDGHTYAYEERVVGTGEEFPREVDALLTDLLKQETPRVGGKPRVHYGPVKTEPSAEFKWTRSTTGYVLLGAAAGLVATGVVFWAQAKGYETQFRAAPHSTSTADKSAAGIRSQGQSAALLGDLFALGGGLTASLGTYFAFFGRSDELPMPPPPTLKRVGSAHNSRND